jgi:hypothetical protein
MNPGTTVPNPTVLNSWKEIANYVGRGVRTVQRWEADLGMPVRRPRAKSRSAVLAMADEIDTWLRSTPTADLKRPELAGKMEVVSHARQNVAEHVILRERCNELRAANERSLAALLLNVKAMKELVELSRRERASHPLETILSASVKNRAAAAFND